MAQRWHEGKAPSSTLWPALTMEMLTRDRWVLGNLGTAWHPLSLPSGVALPKDGRSTGVVVAGTSDCNTCVYTLPGQIPFFSTP